MRIMGKISKQDREKERYQKKWLRNTSSDIIIEARGKVADRIYFQPLSDNDVSISIGFSVFFL